MVKKKKTPPAAPSKAYLISFGDTMTALLAFFIVINSLAREQTGANLYTGTGSFVNAMNASGLPGRFETKGSKNVFQKSEAGPLYVVDDRMKKELQKPGNGPDEAGNALRVIDRERDMLRRFLIEMQEMGDIKALPQTTGNVVFDFFEPIEKTSPLVSDNVMDVFRQALSRATSTNYQVDIVVWASNPGITAWTKATHESIAVKDDLIDRLGVPDRVRSIVTSTGRPWLFSDEKRPRFSISVRKFTR